MATGAFKIQKAVKGSTIKVFFVTILHRNHIIALCEEMYVIHSQIRH